MTSEFAVIVVFLYVGAVRLLDVIVVEPERYELDSLPSRQPLLLIECLNRRHRVGKAASVQVIGIGENIESVKLNKPTGVLIKER